MNLRHLRTFLAVCQTGSFTRAAARVHRSQPAVSRQVRQLEADLGVVLVEQVGKKLRLTDAGRDLRRDARDLLADVDRLEERLRRHTVGTAGRLRVGASTTPAATILPPVLGRLHTAFPDVDLDLYVANSAAIAARIASNELDIGVLGVRPTLDDLVVRPIADDRVVCFVSAGHPRVAARDAHERLWIVRERGSATRQHFDRWLAERGETLRRTIEISSVAALKALVGSGLGIGYLSERLVEGELARGDLVALDLGAPPLVRRIHSVRHVDKHLTPPMVALLDLLAEASTRDRPRV